METGIDATSQYFTQGASAARHGQRGTATSTRDVATDVDTASVGKARGCFIQLRPGQRDTVAGAKCATTAAVAETHHRRRCLLDCRPGQRGTAAGASDVSANGAAGKHRHSCCCNECRSWQRAKPLC